MSMYQHWQQGPIGPLAKALQPEELAVKAKLFAAKALISVNDTFGAARAVASHWRP